jgi:hypothetical protein
VRKLFVVLTAATAIALFTPRASAELGTDNPNDDILLMQREVEAGCDISKAPPVCPSTGSGIFDIPVPDSTQTYTPAERVKRDKFGVVGPFKLSAGLRLQDLDNLVYPSTSAPDKAKLLEGLVFFTMFHTPGEAAAPPLNALNGIGPLNNQPACVGCHLNAAEAVKSKGLLQGQGCTTAGTDCTNLSANVSNVTRAARSTPTNFQFTSLNPDTGGGRAPNNLDALTNTGKTAAFTTFGDFSKTLLDTAPGSIGFFDPLDGLGHSSTTSSFTSQPFGGFVQHHRPSLPAVCFPKPLPPLIADTNLTNGSNSGDNPNGFRRSVGERAGPPYIGRGLMEAVPTLDITYFAANVNPTHPERENGPPSQVAPTLGCPKTGCISGTANMIPRNFTVHTSTTDAQNGTDTGFVGGVGRFGLRANGVEILQFAVGGLQGELSFTSLFNGAEINFPTLFPDAETDVEPLACAQALSQTFGQTQSVLPPPPKPGSPPPLMPGPVNLATLEVHLSEPFSERNFIRNTALPEFGDALLDVLRSPHPGKSWDPDGKQGKVKRGAELFGIDLVAFANRTVGGPMTAGGDGRDDNAINQSDRELNCVGCHTPIRKTGQSPTALTSTGVGSTNLSYKWAPIFSDQLLHHMPVIAGERETTNGLPRNVVVIPRSSTTLAHKDDQDGERDDDSGKGMVFNTFDLPRNLADDTFSNLKAIAEGPQFRTAPLMGIGRIGPPFLHDARVYLSKDTVKKTPAGTVTTNRELANAPLVVRSLDDAILAAIELHDLPAPDDLKKTPKTLGAGCPVPPKVPPINVTETAADICPAYSSPTSQTNRSEAREVIYRFRQLSSEDQQAVIEFLKQL